MGARGVVALQWPRNVGDTFSKQLKKMFTHKHRVVILGSNHKKKHRYGHARMRDFIVKLERDFAERYSAAANKEQQFQYFSKDTSLGIEGITGYLKPKGKDAYKTHFYSIISTEKEQDGRIVYANTKRVLKHIREQLDGGADIEGMSLSQGLIEILDDSDGCAEQYRCGTALYMLHKLAAEEDVIYDRAIDAGGHGKKDIDGHNGTSKNNLSKELRGNVLYQEEAKVDHKRSYMLCDMVDGDRVDFAEVCKEILTNPERSNKVSRNKPRGVKEVSDKSISENIVDVRKKGEAKWVGMKMTALGFASKKKGWKGGGIGSTYNFRFEKALREKFVHCIYPCSCPRGCYPKLQGSTIDERYGGPRDTCYLWPMMQIFDDNGQPTGDGYNDWKFGWFEPRDDCKMDQYNASKADTLREIGETYSREVFSGNFGAYCIANDPKYPFYIVEWIGEPWQVDINEESEEIIIGSQKFVVHKGDWVCRGIWLEKLDGARNWHTMTANRQ